MCLGSLGTVSRRWDEGGVPMASVATPAGESPACLLYHPDVAEGDHVLVHMGFVIDVLDDAAAADAAALRRGEVA